MPIPYIMSYKDLGSIGKCPFIRKGNNKIQDIATSDFMDGRDGKWNPWQ